MTVMIKIEEKRRAEISSAERLIGDLLHSLLNLPHLLHQAPFQAGVTSAPN